MPNVLNANIDFPYQMGLASSSNSEALQIGTSSIQVGGSLSYLQSDVSIAATPALHKGISLQPGSFGLENN